MVSKSVEKSFWQPEALALLVIASCGLHAIAIILAYRGHGDRVSNILMAFSLSAWISAVSIVSPYGLYLAYLGALAFAFHIVSGIISDFDSILFPRHGVGVFFGTFNPVHKTHLQIMKDALKKRGLQKIYVHPTTVPKLHRTALQTGELAMDYQAGMRIYRKTELADPSKNYFPTGNKFYEYEVRNELLKAGIADEGLNQQVQVLEIPDVYDQAGFMGVLRYIKALHPNEPVHGLHGSDVGGMWVRHIFESSGRVYAFPIRRIDNISATAIRGGATGFTSPTVERFLEATRAEKDFVFPSGFVFKSARSKSN